MASLHSVKSLLQKATPFAGMSIMAFSAFLRRGNIFFSEICALVLCLVCFTLIVIQYHENKKHSLHIKSIRAYPLLMCIIIGISYGLFIESSLDIIDSSISYNTARLWGLGSLFLVCWASLLQRAERLYRDPVICYAYWTQSIFMRFPALLSYYASSNGLFITIICCSWIFLFDHALSLQRLGSIDSAYILAYILLSSSAVVWISNRPFSAHKKSRGFLMILFFWAVLALFIYRFPVHWKFSGSMTSFSKEVLFLSFQIPQYQESAALTLPFSLYIIWGVFWGSALSGYMVLHPLFLFVTSMSIKAGLMLYPIIYNSPWHASLPAFFFGVLLINGLRSKSAVHSIDCPWRETRRNTLKPTRWLLAMGLGPWTFCMIYYLYGKSPVFFALHNFSLLVVFGLLYPILWELSSLIYRYTFPLYKTWGPEFAAKQFSPPSSQAYNN